MSGKTKLVLIACGSFNPLTIMHLRMFEICKDFLLKRDDCDVIGGIISPVNDHYKSTAGKFIAPAKQRCDMVRLSLRPLHGSQHWIRLSEWESNQDHWVRTVEVLRHHRAELNRNSAERIHLKLLCGADMFDSFNIPNLWKDEDIEEIARDFGMVIVTRHKFDANHTLLHSGKSNILQKHKDNILIVEEKLLNSISSSFIRNSLAKRESVRYLLDDSVLEYIIEHKLYLPKD